LYRRADAAGNKQAGKLLMDLLKRLGDDWVP
jgi:hypothetical protein